MSISDRLSDRSYRVAGPVPRPGFIVVLLFALRHPRLTYKALVLYWLERRLDSAGTTAGAPRPHTGLVTYSEAFVAKHAEQRAQRILNEGGNRRRSIDIRVQLVNQQVVAREAAVGGVGRTPIRLRDHGPGVVPIWDEVPGFGCVRRGVLT